MTSNLRPTTRECVRLNTHGHFSSRDKDGGHTIRSANAENRTLHAKSTAVYFIEPEFQIARIGIVDYFCSCELDLDLDPTTFLYELELCPFEIYWMCESEFIRQGFGQIQIQVY